MAYKNLLLHLDNSKACEKRVAVGLDLAQRFDAHLVGLYVSPELNVPSYIEAHLSDELRENQMTLRRQKAEQVIAAFEEAARLAAVSVESRQVSALLNDIPEVLALHGRYSDLVILGQHDPDDDQAIPAPLIGETLLGLGHPALLVPYIGVPEGFGRQIMLAWDAGREAARAASDALPFLRRADLVRIVTVNPKRGIHGHGDTPGADIALSLARHGVTAKVQQMASEELEVADLLLSRAADFGTDMIVLGAYAHSRVRDLIFGGVTRSLLRHTTLPLLLSQ